MCSWSRCGSMRATCQRQRPLSGPRSGGKSAPRPQTARLSQASLDGEPFWQEDHGVRAPGRYILLCPPERVVRCRFLGGSVMRVTGVATPMSAAVLFVLAGCQSQPGGLPSSRPDGGMMRDGGRDRAEREPTTEAGRADRPDAHDAGPRDAVGETATDAAAAEAGPDGGSGDASAVDGALDGGLELLGAPLVFAPTASSFGVSVVLRSGDPTTLALELRADDSSPWTMAGPPLSPAPDIAQWSVGDLLPGHRYSYAVVVPGDGGGGSAAPLYLGSAA